MLDLACVREGVRSIGPIWLVGLAMQRSPSPQTSPTTLIWFTWPDESDIPGAENCPTCSPASPVRLVEQRDMMALEAASPATHTLTPGNHSSFLCQGWRDSTRSPGAPQGRMGVILPPVATGAAVRAQPRWGGAGRGVQLGAHYPLVGAALHRFGKQLIGAPTRALLWQIHLALSGGRFC